MPKRSFLLGFCLFLANTFASSPTVLAQNSFEYLYAKNKVVLASVCLKNEDAVLPYASVATKNTALLTIGPGSPFAQMAGKYLPLSHYVLRTGEGLPVIREKIAQWRKEGYQRLIVHVVASASTRQNYGLTSQSLQALPLVLAEMPTVLVVNGPQGLLNILPWESAKAVVFSPDQAPLAQGVLAQAVFGAQTIGGEAPRLIGRAAITAQPLKSLGRLRYGRPEEQGMDGRFLESGVDAICSQGIAEGAFPGCQVLVARNGMVVFHKAYGYHTYAQQTPVQLDDIYDYASLTKVTAALPAFIRLHGQGRFDVENGVWGDYSPQLKGSDKADLGLKEILSHQAGLQPWIPYWKNTLRKNGSYKWSTLKARESRRFPLPVDGEWFVHRKYQNKISEAIAESPLSGAGTYRYSGLMFYLAPQMVTDLVGQPFELFLKETFYRPLGAHSITFNPSRYFPLDKIVPTEVDGVFRKKLIHGYVHDEGAAMMGGVSSNAGLFSTANDLAKLAQLYLNSGEYGDERFFSAESMAFFTKRHFEATGNRRALGFDKPRLTNKADDAVSVLASEESYGHSGYTGTFLWIDPEESLIYIFFSNRVHPNRERGQIYDLSIRPRIHHVLYESISQEKLDIK